MVLPYYRPNHAVRQLKFTLAPRKRFFARTLFGLFHAGNNSVSRHLRMQLRIAKGRDARKKQKKQRKQRRRCAERGRERAEESKGRHDRRRRRRAKHRRRQARRCHAPHELGHRVVHLRPLVILLLEPFGAHVVFFDQAPVAIQRHIAFAAEFYVIHADARVFGRAVHICQTAAQHFDVVEQQSNVALEHDGRRRFALVQARATYSIVDVEPPVQQRNDPLFPFVYDLCYVRKILYPKRARSSNDFVCDTTPPRRTYVL